VRSRGTQVEVVDDERCVALMRDFVITRPELWDEDIGR
jgi:cytosine deaminase